MQGVEARVSPPGRVVCFGEVLLRLTASGGGLLLQDRRLDVCYGGAEANVAVSLARLGHASALVSVLPGNLLGSGAIEELRGHGVDVGWIARSEGRMGLYFLTPGAVLRPSEVIYDRAHSAFAQADPGLIDWEQVLDGAARLHLSGVTPAIGPKAAEAALRAVRVARRGGTPVSFDGNYRAKLWGAWDGDGPKILGELLDHADLAFVDERDIALVLGQTYPEPDANTRLRTAADAAFARFPNLKRIACTIRTQDAVTAHVLSAVMLTRTTEFAAGPYRMSGIVDRIGAGDAFAAGVLHGDLIGAGDEQALRLGLAAAVFKHSVPGDFNLATAEDLTAALAGGLDVKR